MLNEVTNSILTVVLVILAIFVLICLLRAVIGPRVADRIVCVNMMGTMVMVIIAILAVKEQEGYLADICVLYAMISFLAVVVLCKVYMGVYLEHKRNEEQIKAVKIKKVRRPRDVDFIYSNNNSRSRYYVPWIVNLLIPDNRIYQVQIYT